MPHFESRHFEPRPTGVKLRLLDTASITKQAHEETGDTYSVGLAPWAAVEHNGTLYAVCNEGVGYRVTQRLELLLYKEVPGHISIVPTFQVTLSPDEVRELMTDDEVDLADLVRRFGARLEGNFWNLYSRLSEA